MKSTLIHRSLGRLLGTGLLALALVCVTGCGIEQLFHWSPDGRYAAISAKDGLYLCDQEGRLSLLFPEGRRVAWLPDSKHLVVSLTHPAKDWAEMAAVLMPEELRYIEQFADTIAKKIETGPVDAALSVEMDKVGMSRRLVLLCLRSKYQALLDRKLDKNQRERLLLPQAVISELAIARLDEGKPVIELSLGRIGGEVMDIRPAPDCQAIVISSTNEKIPGGIGRLQLALVNRPGLSDLTVGASFFPDWSPDSRSLVYEQGQLYGAVEAGEASVGKLLNREVRNARGEIAIASMRKELAGLMHSDKTRVRCLKDGRILFNAVDLKLPLSSADFRELPLQLYMLDPQRHASLIAIVPAPFQKILSDEFAFYEVSPDESRVLFLTGSRHTIDVLTLATGDVAEKLDYTKGKYAGLPSWNAQGEIVYFKSNEGAAAGKDNERPFEIVVMNDKTERVLSNSWSSAFLKGLEYNDDY